MSGYLEVKYPFKSSLGLNPFKTWKKQWCILRPSATLAGGGSLAVYCSEAGAAAGCVGLPAGGAVRRAASRSRAHAFAVFAAGDCRKPRVLLAAASAQDAQLWMDKIKALLTGSLHGTDSLLKDSYPVTVVSTDWSVRCGLAGADGTLALSAQGLTIMVEHKEGTFVQWRHISDVTVDNRSCEMTIDSGCPHGRGALCVRSSRAAELGSTLAHTVRAPRAPRPLARAVSRSDGDLRSGADDESGDVRRSSWYSGPSDVSLDDTDLVIAKECSRPATLSRAPRRALLPARDHTSAGSLASCMSDRRSLLSVASGVYEEIPDAPTDEVDGEPIPERVLRDIGSKLSRLEEPTYESVAECVYATMRRRRAPPPPLPPRLPFSTSKLGESWGSRMNKCPPVTRAGSLGSLRPLPRPSPHPLPPSPPQHHTRTLPKAKPFSVFRKRLKSDTAIVKDVKENSSSVETKKKKFDFTPTRDIFKSFKVGRKMKGLKLAGALKKGETKSCEFLDDAERVPAAAARPSRSVECLETSDDLDVELAVECSDESAAELSLPQHILDLILQGRRQLATIRHVAEDDYMPMSPIVAPSTPIEQHYIVMSPRTNIA
ncbi:unnamed protein product [Plutella xylostella]|uniref:(diamondback moth) hypothetical protein n=1 Tax=Plutella xylostella TaxID=51655 RepID=A0A8S4G7J2_PLUXY|nr:unnamed protein product [Plutella xylostella]